MSSEQTAVMCTYCQQPIIPNTDIKVCPNCHTWYHSECWRNNNGCSMADCAHQSTENTTQRRHRWILPAMVGLTLIIVGIIYGTVTVPKLQSNTGKYQSIGGENTTTEAPQIPPATGKIYFLSDGDHYRELNVTRHNGSVFYEIYSMNADGSGQERLTTLGSKGCCINGFDICPDGNSLAISCQKFGAQSGEIYLMDSDGTNIRKATNISGLWDAGYQVPFDAPLTPTFCGGNDRILFTLPSYNSFATIWKATVEGDLEQIPIQGVSNNNYTECLKGTVILKQGVAVPDVTPMMSPDGKTIVFSNGIIVLMNSDGSNARRVSQGNGRDWNPIFTPDGAYILFDSDRGGNQDVYRMRADGSQIEQLTDSPAFDGEPSVSPDGHYVVFSSERNGARNIYRMTINGKDVQRLTVNADWHIRPRWGK